MGRNRNQDISSVLLRYEVDERSVSDSLKAADAVLKRYRDLVAGAGEITASVAGTQQALQRQSSALGDQSAALDRANRLIQRMNALQDDARSTLRQVQAQVDATGRSYKEASKDVQSFGQVQSALGSLSGTLRGFGLGGLADIVGAGADVSGAVEDLGRVGPALREAGTTAAGAISNLTGMSVSVGAVGAAAGVAVVAVGALALAFAEWQRQNEEVVKGVRAYISAQEELAGILPDLTEEERARRMEELNAAIQANQERVDLLQRSYDQITDGMGVLTTAADILNMRGLQDMRTEMERLRAQILEDNVVLGELRGETGQTAAATTEATLAEEALAAARLKGENAARAALVSAARAADEAAARAQYDASLESLEAAQEMIRFEEELAGVRKQARSSASTLQDAARQRMASLEDQYAKAEQTANASIAKLQAEAVKKRSDIEKEYMQESLEATQEYLAEERNAQDDANRERIRRVEDLADDLLSAEEDNDVIRFIQAQRAGQKDLRRMDEDAAVAEKRRSEEFQAEQAQRKDEAAQRLADLRDDTAERIAEIRRGLQDQRRTLNEQIRQEQTALQDRLRLNQQALATELDVRRKAHAISLQEEAVYAQQRLTIQQQLNSTLAAIAARAYSGGALKSTGYTAAMSSKSFGLPTATSNISPTFNITMGNIGSNISKSEVQASLVGAVKAFSAATIAGLSGGK